MALKRDFRVSRAKRVRVEQQYLLSGYRLVIPRKTEITSTGRFVLFRLLPPKGLGRRVFLARWDNAAVKGKQGPAVKIEVDHPSRRERLAFKRSLDGYAGHWPTQDRDRDRFSIAIVDRGTLVFRGTLSLGLIWALDFSLVDPGDKFQLCTADGLVVAELPVAALGPTVLRVAKLAKHLVRKGRSKRVTWRLAGIATAGMISASAATIYRPDLLSGPSYTRAEQDATRRRIIRRLLAARRRVPPDTVDPRRPKGK
jgi:hypothetical protein